MFKWRASVRHPGPMHESMCRYGEYEAVVYYETETAAEGDRGWVAEIYDAEELDQARGPVEPIDWESFDSEAQARQWAEARLAQLATQ